MEENYLLEKEYTIPYDIFRDAYRNYQKKYVFPKSRMKIIAFIVLAAAAAFLRLSLSDSVSSKAIYLSYIFFVAFCAFAFRSWYQPNKMRENLVESVKALGEPVYKIGVSGSYVDISTISDDSSNDIEYDEEEAENDPLPEKTRISINSGLELLEYSDHFLLIPDSSVLYIIPKKGFDEAELGTIRNIKTNADMSISA